MLTPCAALCVGHSVTQEETNGPEDAREAVGGAGKARIHLGVPRQVAAEGRHVLARRPGERRGRGGREGGRNVCPICPATPTIRRGTRGAVCCPGRLARSASARAAGSGTAPSGRAASSWRRTRWSVRWRAAGCLGIGASRVESLAALRTTYRALSCHSSL